MWLLALAALSGVSFSFIGIAYRVGQSRGIEPLPIVFVLGLTGALVYTVRAGAGSFGGLPARVFLLAAAAGLAQYVVAKLIGRALAMGPLSPLWCAIGLGFIPAVVYAHIGLAERIGSLQAAGVAAGVLCVLAGSLQQASHNNSRLRAGVPRPRGGVPLYGLVLFVIFAFNGTSHIAIKNLSSVVALSGRTYMQQYRDAYYALFYAAFALPALIDLAVRRAIPRPFAPMLGLGLIAGAGSTAGLWLIAAVSSNLSAAVMFTISGVMSILIGAFVSVLCFREKLTPAWVAMMALGVLALVLLNAPGAA